ncbi:MAG: hypothetical protein SFV21_16670, partial [Rhodospirillaceae bacterium]|nr:hypothetical protein [Rhodospirillaceae bacterium]
MLLAGVAASLGLWVVLLRGEQHALDVLLATKAQQFALTVAKEFEDLDEGLSRMAERAEAFGEAAEARWQKDARSFIRDFPYLLYVQRVDAGFNVRWRVTRGGQVLSLNDAIAPSDALLAGMEAARTAGVVQISRINRDDAGQPFVVVSAPIFIDGGFDGLITARVTLQNMFDALYDRSELAAAVAVAANGEPVFRSGEFNDKTAGRPTVRHEVEINRLSVRAEAQATPALVRANASAAPYAVLAAGLVLSAMGAGLTHQRGQLARFNDTLTAQRDRATEREMRFRDLLRGVEMGFVVV